MLRLSKLADYAVVVLAQLSCEGSVQTSPGLAAVPHGAYFAVASLVAASSPASVARAAGIVSPDR